jgi:hypothetical protein
MSVSSRRSRSDMNWVNICLRKLTLVGASKILPSISIISQIGTYQYPPRYLSIPFRATCQYPPRYLLIPSEVPVDTLRGTCQYPSGVPVDTLRGTCRYPPRHPLIPPRYIATDLLCGVFFGGWLKVRFWKCVL